MNAPDTWRPSASISLLKQRAAYMSRVRSFFTERGFWEVETPVLSHFGVTDVYLKNMKTHVAGRTYYMQTSPEYHMKRLLAADSGSIFQLARVFRDDEIGRWHNPEFTLLEWYQLDVDHHQLIQMVDLFLQDMLGCAPMRCMTYQHAFQEFCQLQDVHTAALEDLRNICERFDLGSVFSHDETDRDAYLFLLMSHVIEPALALKNIPIALTGFPLSQASLAQVHDGVAARFEVYYHGLELANGFHELTDLTLQKERFQNDLQQRAAHNLDPQGIDEYFLAALDHGLPACSGVALGIDRLLMLALEQSSLAQTMAFDFSRA